MAISSLLMSNSAATLSATDVDEFATVMSLYIRFCCSVRTCCVQGSVVVQHSQLGEFVEALGAQQRFGFCCVPLPPTSPTPPVLPESLRLPQPDAGGSHCLYTQSLGRFARHTCCQGQPHSRTSQAQRTESL